MASEKDAERQEETPETPEETPEDETPKEESTETPGEEIKESNSLTGVLNAKIVALAIVGIVVGILIGQVALPGIGIGLVALGAEGNTGIDAGIALNDTELEAKVQDYIQQVVEPQGLDVKVISIDSFNDSFYTVNFTLLRDGQSQGDSMIFLTKDGLALVGNPPMMLDESVPQQPDQPTQPTGAPVVGELGSFKDSGDEIELQDGKPVIRLFSSSSCGYCNWVKETFEAVANEYVAEGKIVAYNWEFNSQDNLLSSEVETVIPDTEVDIFNRFNPSGGVPTFVFGGKYYRIGVAYKAQDDLGAEAADFRAVIEALIAEANQ